MTHKVYCRVGAYGLGTHECSCRTGFELQSNGVTCLPRCSRLCAHGGICTAPEKCEGCESGWIGQYCEIAMCDNKIEYTDSRGQLISTTGCYHGGRCAATDSCVDCQSGWTGDSCATSPNAGYSLALAIVNVAVSMPTLWMVIHRRLTAAIQERGVSLMVICNVGCQLWVTTSQLAAFPQLAGILLSAHQAEPELSWTGLWLPFTLGYVMWSNALLIRGRTYSKSGCLR